MLSIKDKERILKAARWKNLVTYGGDLIILSADFSKETLQARRHWQELFKFVKSRDLQPKLLCLAKLSFRMEGQIRKEKTKGVHHQQTIIIWNVKGTYLRKRRSELWTIKRQKYINTPTIESKKQTKQTRWTERESCIWECFDGCQMESGLGKWVMIWGD